MPGGVNNDTLHAPFTEVLKTVPFSICTPKSINVEKVIIYHVGAGLLCQPSRFCASHF